MIYRQNFTSYFKEIYQSVRDRVLGFSDDFRNFSRLELVAAGVPKNVALTHYDPKSPLVQSTYLNRGYFIEGYEERNGSNGEKVVVVTRGSGGGKKSKEIILSPKNIKTDSKGYVGAKLSNEGLKPIRTDLKGTVKKIVDLVEKLRLSMGGH